MSPSWAPLASFLVAAGSLTVAIIAVSTAAIDRRRAARAQDLVRRRSMVQQVIARLERISRVQSRPVYGRLWHNPQIEFALATADLSVLVAPDETPLVDWLGTQVTRMQSAPSNRAATDIGIRATTELAAWFRGTRQIEWFRTETAAFQPPRPSRVRPYATTMEFLATSGIIILGTAGTIAGLTAAERACLAAVRTIRDHATRHVARRTIDGQTSD